MNDTPAALITSNRQLRDKVAAQPVKHGRLLKLRDWQVARLRSTYADFSSQPRYRDALDFFVDDLYGPRDDSQRDRQLDKVLRMLQRLLPAQAVRALLLALQLEGLSLSLDLDMTALLDEGDITSIAYQKAYCSVRRVADRKRQIVLIVAAGQALDGLVRNPAIGAALWAAALPARVAGVAVLHQFLERGYRAFSEMRGAGKLLAAIERRETVIMNNLLTAVSEPFEWQRAEPTGAMAITETR